MKAKRTIIIWGVIIFICCVLISYFLQSSAPFLANILLGVGASAFVVALMENVYFRDTFYKGSNLIKVSHERILGSTKAFLFNIDDYTKNNKQIPITFCDDFTKNFEIICDNISSIDSDLFCLSINSFDFKNYQFNCEQSKLSMKTIASSFRQKHIELQLQKVSTNIPVYANELGIQLNMYREVFPILIDGIEKVNNVLLSKKESQEWEKYKKDLETTITSWEGKF